MLNSTKSAYELIDFISDDGRKGLAMIRAYLDESGTHKGSSLTVVAGWVGLSDAWKSFTKEWNGILKKSGTPYFHAKDPKCEPLKGPLAHSIAKRKLLGVAWALAPSDFKENTSDQFKTALGNPYSTCAYLCTIMITRIAKRYSYESIALVFESGQRNEGFIHETFSAIMAEPNVDHRISSLSFLDKKEPGAVPLQAADFLAHAISTNEQQWISYFKKRGQLFPPVKMPPEKIRETSIKIKRIMNERRRLRKGDQHYGGSI